MINYSKNKKLNNVLNTIREELLDEMPIEEIERYYKEFRGVSGYNIVQYGSMRIYYDDIRDLYADYKSLKNASDDKLWNIYIRQVGYIVRSIISENKGRKAS